MFFQTRIHPKLQSLVLHPLVLCSRLSQSYTVRFTSQFVQNATTRFLPNIVLIVQIISVVIVFPLSTILAWEKSTNTFQLFLLHVQNVALFPVPSFAPIVAILTASHASSAFMPAEGDRTTHLWFLWIWKPSIPLNTVWRSKQSFAKWRPRGYHLMVFTTTLKKNSNLLLAHYVLTSTVTQLGLFSNRIFP